MNGEAPVALVLGAGGLVGGALCDQLGRAGWRVVAASRAVCDIRDGGALRALCADARPAVVFNAAAYTNVDGAEANPGLARAVNADGAEAVALAAAGAGAAVVHYSTDFVFDGEQERPYDERDPPSPLGAYARSKAEGDARVAAATPRHFILRVGCVYGRGGRNFPSTLVRRLRAGDALRVDAERRVSPTWVREVAAVSIALAPTSHYGLYHCTAHGETTWADFARALARELGLPHARIEPVSDANLGLAARRPRRAVLDKRMLRLRGLDGLLSPWEQALRAYVAEETGDGSGREQAG
ncbi:MAG TPA: dTDP-4-dehydrorhamnose reductase [Polyangia bacterium]|nr:dTDP-4-dehydrorhamnose reductase [Polyangia bacterium]